MLQVNVACALAIVSAPQLLVSSSSQHFGTDIVLCCSRMVPQSGLRHLWSVPPTIVCRPKNRHTSLALYILLRGLTLLVRCGNKPTAHPWVHRALAPTRWRHGDTALMCLSTSQIGYSWIMMPWTLPPSYVSFLNKHGGKPHYLYRAAQVHAYLTLLASTSWNGTRMME